MARELDVAAQPLDDGAVAARGLLLAHDVAAEQDIVGHDGRIRCQERLHLLEVVDVLALGRVDKDKVIRPLKLRQELACVALQDLDAALVGRARDEPMGERSALLGKLERRDMCVRRAVGGE